MNNKRLTQVFVTLFALLILAVLLSQISVSDLARAFSSISPGLLVICLVLYAGMNVARAARFSVMLKRAGSLHAFFNIVCIHTMASNIMPFKTGELAFVYLAKTRLSLSLGLGVVTVAIARLYDSLAVCLLFIFALAMAGDGLGLFSAVTPVMLALAVLLSLAVISIMWFGPAFVAVLRMVPDVTVFKRNIIGFLRSKVEEVSAYYSSGESRRNIPAILFLSMVIWSLNSAMVFFLISGLGIPLNLWLIVIGAMVSVIFSVFPIHGIGQFGTTELVWAGILAALGTAKEVAISSGLVIHLVVFSLSVLLGLYALAEAKFLAIRAKTGVKQ